MFLDIQKIPAEGLHFDQALQLPPLAVPGGDVLRPQGVHLRGTATPGGRGIDLRAHLDAEMTLTCGRCLDPVPFPLSTDLSLILLPQDVAKEPAGEVEVTDDDAALFACPDGKCDLAALATEQIYLALPLKPLCSEACLGLCPQCGQNRNRGACSCPREEIDPRLAPLLQFRRNPSGS